MMTDDSTSGPERELPPQGVRDLLGLGLGVNRPWPPEQLRVVLAEQLAEPLEFELSAMDRTLAQRLRVRAREEGLLIRSLGELLSHPKPPVDLLVLAKDFFKRNQGHPQSELPSEVCQALYYLCIAVALWRHQRRITQLSDAELADAFRWMEAQPWMGELGKQAAAAAAERLPG